MRYRSVPLQTKLSQGDEITANIESALAILQDRINRFLDPCDKGVIQPASSPSTVALPDGIKDLVQEIVRLLVQITKSNESQRFLTDNVAFLLERQCASVMCWRRLKETLFQQMSWHSKGSELRSLWKSIELDYADSLREYGAILSDQYRRTSRSSYHIDALEAEIEAARIAVRAIDTELDSCVEGYDKITLRSLDGLKGLPFLLSTFNALSVSTYRIKRYDVSLPISLAATTILSNLNKKVKASTKERIKNNYASARYSFAHDFREGAIVWPMEGFDWTRDPKMSLVRSAELRLSVDRLNESGNLNWNARITLAECHAELGEMEDALDCLLAVKKDITMSHQGTSIYMSRCSAVLARVQLARAEEKHDFTDQERLDCLLESLTYATEALRLTALLDGPFHLDVGKRIKLIARIVGELIGRIEDSDLSKTRGTLDPSTDKSFEKLCSDADEISGLFALLPKDDVVRLHRFYSDEIERLLHVVIDGGISVDEGESPTQVANLLVRGDEVDPNTLFDFKGPSKLKGLLKPFFEKRFDPWRGLSFREASEADAESIRDLMVSARNSCSQPDFYAISDVDRIRNKFSNGARAVLAFKNQELVAFYIATPLVGDERSWLGKAIDIPDEALDHAWCMDSVAVADTCRGLGLQRKLAEDLESELIGKGVEIFAATVDPRNTPSIRNFILGGYDIVDVDERFFNGESPRALMVKYADGRCPELKDGGVAIDLSDSE